MVSLPGPAIEATSSSNHPSYLKSKLFSDEVKLLDYLSTDFAYLRRFILASDQMLRLLQTETARNNQIIQEKLVETLEIAKETLSEAGASARPFIACPAHLVRFREAYFAMLSAARTLVPYMKDPDAKLRLRRLILPLTSTSRFRVVLPSEHEARKADCNLELPTWWGKHENDIRAASLGPTGLAKGVSRRRVRRGASASAVLKFAQSPLSYTSCYSDSATRPFSSESVASARHTRGSPYPRLVVRENKQQLNGSLSDEDANESVEQQQLSEVAPEESSSTRGARPQPASEEKPSEPVIHYVSPLSPRPYIPPRTEARPKAEQQPSHLQQRHQDFAVGYPAYREDSGDPPTANSANSDGSSQTRTSLSGIDCNVPQVQNTASVSVLKVFSKEEYDEADENFRKGLGWRPNCWRTPMDPSDTASPSVNMKWAARWDDDENPVPTSELVTTMLAKMDGEPIQPQQPAPLSESICTIM